MQADFPSRCDVLVIGAGPAGSAAAIELAHAGLHVVLLEKRRFPREKVCGCCLNPAAARELQALHAQEAIDSSIPTDSLEIRVAGHCAVVPQDGAVISRGTLDSILLSLARRRGVAVWTQAGAQVHRDRETPGRRVDVLLDGRSVELDAAFVIVADGISGSALRNLPEFDWRIDPDGLMGLGCLVHSRADPPPGRILMGIGSDGYVGLVRLENGLTDVAAAVKPDFVRSCGDPARAVALLCAQAGIEPFSTHPAIRATPRLTRSRRSVESRRLIVAGDAAAYVEPFTGEGISWALWSGRRAAHRAVHALQGTHPARPWSDELNRGLATRHVRCRIVAGLLRRADLCAALIQTAAALPKSAARVSRLFGRPWPQPAHGATP